MSRYLATGQSEIVLGKTHPIVLKTVLWSCLEMSSDLNYNFDFVVGEIVVPGHTNLVPRVSHLTLGRGCVHTRKSRKKIRTLTRVNELSYNINIYKNWSWNLQVGTLWEYSIFVQKGRAILMFYICCGRILLASSFYKNLDSRARLFEKLDTQQSNLNIHE